MTEKLFIRTLKEKNLLNLFTMITIKKIRIQGIVEIILDVFILDEKINYKNFF
jgi:hypothetical protein